MKTKTKFILMILALLMLFNSNFIANANENKYTQAKQDSYKALAEAYYNNNVYDKYREEVIDTIGKLVDKSNQLYGEDDDEKALLYKRLKSMFSILTQAKKSLPTQKDKAASYNTEEKLKQIQSSGDAALAYILKDALLSNDYNIKINAAASIVLVDEKSSLPVFLDLLKSDSENNIIIALNALANLKNAESVPDVINILDQTKSDKLKQASIKTLSKIRTEEALDEIKKFTSDNDSTVKNLALSVLISGKDDSYKKSFLSLLQNSETEDKIAPLLIDIVDRLQDKSLDLVDIALKSSNKSVRIVGLLSLEKLIDKDKAIDLFINEAKDDNDDVKYVLVKVLSKYNSPKILPILKDIHFKSDEHYEKSIQLLLNSDNPEVKQFLAEIFNTSTSKIKIAIANYFIDKGTQSNEYTDYLKSLLTNSSDESRYIAASILYQHGHNEAKQTIEEMFKSDNPFVKLRALVLFSSKRDEIVKPTLEEFVSKNKDINKNYGASLILYNIGDDRYIDNLIDYLSQPKLEPISKEYINKDLFNTFLSYENDWVKLNSAQNLYKTGDTSYLKYIRKLINSKEVKVRAQVAKLLGQYGDKSDIDLLHKMVNDDYVRIRVNASEAILRILSREEKATRS